MRTVLSISTSQTLNLVLLATAVLGLLVLPAQTAKGKRTERREEDTSDQDALRFTAWPGSPSITTADVSGTFKSNLSGLTFQSATSKDPALLWAVQNGPSTLYRLEQTGAVWAASLGEAWSAGKTVFYPDGTGAPDCEGLTLAETGSPAIYIATERDNTNNGTSRLSVLRVDTGDPGTKLVATHEWDLTASLPSVAANLGLETITWIPDSYLVAGRLRVEGSGLLYNPADYPEHGSGIFLVGVEASGTIYAFALNHADSSFQKIATIDGGQAHVVGMEFDRDQEILWTYCDNTCGNRATLLALLPISTNPRAGYFEIVAAYERPIGMPDLNNEGIAIAPEADCRDGEKTFFWADDSSDDQHALRTGTIPCGSPISVR